MEEVTLGFVGGGRVTALLLRGLKRSGALPARIVVADPNAAGLRKMEAIAPGVIRCTADNREVAAAHVVFLAVHPPVAPQVLAELRDQMAERSILVSPVPTIPMARLTAGLGGFTRLVRMTPNAPSILGQGYNPVVFHPSVGSEDRQRLLGLFGHSGPSPEVEERLLEAYAILTAMGPTCFWFQWLEMQRLAGLFGLEESTAKTAIAAMLHGAVAALFESGSSPAEVLDLIPVHPLKDQEESIRQIISAKLTGVHRKLTGSAP